MNKHDGYFMGVAELTAKESHCIRKKVGAVMVRDNFIIATGRNGTLPNHPNDCECMNEFNELVTSEFTLHAEQNILTFCNREGIKTKDTTLYITLSPCKTCAKLVASAGVNRVVYKENYRDADGIDFLQKVGIIVDEFK